MASEGRRPEAPRRDDEEEQQGPDTTSSSESSSIFLKTAKKLLNDGSYVAQKLVKSTGEALTRLSESTELKEAMRTAKGVAYEAKRLMKNMGNATWIFYTTFFILVVPIIVKCDREQQLIEYEAELEQQANN